jgi:hypothetical protein
MINKSNTLQRGLEDMAALPTKSVKIMGCPQVLKGMLFFPSKMKPMTSTDADIATPTAHHGMLTA